MSHDSLFSPMTADPYPRYPGPSEVSTHANRASTHLRAAASVDVLASRPIIFPRLAFGHVSPSQNSCAMASGLLAAVPLGIAAPAPRSRRRTRRGVVHVAAVKEEDPLVVENCSGCLGPDSCPCPKAIRRAKQRRSREASGRRAEAEAAPGRRAMLSALAAVAMGGSGAVVPAGPAVALENGLVSDAWSAISGAPSDLTFPEDFLGTWLCYSTLTSVDNLQGENMVQDMAVVNRARKDVGQQIVYPMRFVKNDQGRVVMDRAYNVVKMAEATARAYNVIDSVEWDINDPNVLRGRIGGADGRSVFFRVNQRSEEYPESDRIETSEVAQIVFDGGDNGGYAPTPTEDGLPSNAIPVMSLGENEGMPGAKQPKVKSSRTFTKWKFRSSAVAKDGPAIVASQNVYDYLTSFDNGFIESRGQPVTQYTYKLALFKANQYNLDN